MLLIPLVFLLYIPLNHDNGNVHNLVTALDRSIPFSQFFVVPYLAWYALIFVFLFWFMLEDNGIYLSALFSILAGLLASFLIFRFFQTFVPRPVVPEQGIFMQLTRMVYNLDNPYNAFPSIHVMTSSIIFLGGKHAKEYSKSISWLAQGTAVLIVLSTLFLKQHTLLDAAGGIILGVTLYKTAETLIGLNTASRLTSARYAENINFQNSIQRTFSKVS